jgi:hypothetical protein
MGIIAEVYAPDTGICSMGIYNKNVDNACMDRELRQEIRWKLNAETRANYLAGTRSPPIKE